MKTAILACGTLKQELTAVMNKCSCSYPVIWLVPGAHNHPQKRRTEILQALEQCREYDTVLLAMAHCGGALEGIVSPGPTLVLPRFDDCIPLLLGSRERRQELKDFYFLSPGWLEGNDNIRTEFQRSIARYGKERTLRIFRTMLKHYRYLGYISMDRQADRQYQGEIVHFADMLGLEPVLLDWKPDYLIDLVTRNHDPDRFLTVPAGVPITREIACGRGAENHA